MSYLASHTFLHFSFVLHLLDMGFKSCWFVFTGFELIEKKIRLESTWWCRVIKRWGPWRVWKMVHMHMTRPHIIPQKSHLPPQDGLLWSVPSLSRCTFWGHLLQDSQRTRHTCRSWYYRMGFWLRPPGTVKQLLIFSGLLQAFFCDVFLILFN